MGADVPDWWAQLYRRDREHLQGELSQGGRDQEEGGGEPAREAGVPGDEADLYGSGPGHLAVDRVLHEPAQGRETRAADRCGLDVPVAGDSQVPQAAVGARGVPCGAVQAGEHGLAQERRAGEEVQRERGEPGDGVRAGIAGDRAVGDFGEPDAGDGDPRDDVEGEDQVVRDGGGPGGGGECGDVHQADLGLLCDRGERRAGADQDCARSCDGEQERGGGAGA